MKIGLSVTVHDSELNPTGYSDLKLALDSFKDFCLSDKYIVVVDNQSENVDVAPVKMASEYIIVTNQKAGGGLTGAWNRGVAKCVENGCDVIINSNEDVLFNKSLNDFTDLIYNFDDKVNGLFGPITNIGGTSTYHQQRPVATVTKNLIETTNQLSSHGGQGYALNGFFTGFSKEFYDKFNVDGNLFSTKEKDFWGGQEVELFERCTPQGMRSFIAECCYVQHKKNKAWLRRRNDSK